MHPGGSAWFVGLILSLLHYVRSHNFLAGRASLSTLKLGFALTNINFGTKLSGPLVSLTAFMSIWRAVSNSMSFHSCIKRFTPVALVHDIVLPMTCIEEFRWICPSCVCLVTTSLASNSFSIKFFLSSCTISSGCPRYNSIHQSHRAAHIAADHSACRTLVAPNFVSSSTKWRISWPLMWKTSTNTKVSKVYSSLIENLKRR